VLARASGFFIAETQPKNLSLGGCVHRVTAGMVCAVEFSDDGVSTVWRDIRRRDGYRITSTHHANGCQVGPERGCSEPVAVSGRCEANQPLRRVTHDPRTRLAMVLIGELVAGLRAHAPDLFKRWLSVGLQDLRVTLKVVIPVALHP